MNYLEYKDENKINFFHLSKEDVLYKELTPDIYSLTSIYEIGNLRQWLSRYKINEGLVKFNSGIIGKSIEDISEFFSEKTTNIYKEMKIVHKLGILYYGKPGTGKTSCVLLLLQKLIEKYNAICLIADYSDLKASWYAIQRIRRIQNNPIILFFDEVDKDIKQNEEDFLKFLDGTESVDKCIFIGCTNYLDRIPSRIRNRKSRIKYCYEISSLPVEVYFDYINTKCSSLDKLIKDEFSYKAEENKLTIDQFKNALLDYRVDNLSIDNSIKKALKQFDDKEVEV